MIEDEVGSPALEVGDTDEDTGFRVVRVLGLSVRVHITEARENAAAAPPLVLCNGIGASLEVLDSIVTAFDGSREVIRLDVPGAGSSPPPPYPYLMPGMALLVARVLSALGHERFDVLGYSWGGALAQQLAWQFPNRCRRMILVSTSSGALALPGHPRALAKMLTPRRHRDSRYAAMVAPTLYGGVLRQHPDSATELLGEHTRAGSTWGYLLQLTAIAGWTSLPWLPMIRQRALLLFGDDDPIIPVCNGKMMARLLPRGRLVVFSGGHLDFVARADELVPLVDEFLAKV